MEQHLEGQHPVPGVEEQATEQLVGFVAQLRLQVITHGLRTLQHRVAAQSFSQVPPRHLQHGLQLRVLGWPEAEPEAEGIDVRLQQGTQAAEVVEQVAGEVDRALPGDPGTQENGEEFGVGEGRRALFEASPAGAPPQASDGCSWHLRG